GDDPLAVRQPERADDRIRQAYGDRVRGLRFRPLGAALAVDADADLHPPVRQIERRAVAAGQRARPERDGHAARIARNASAQLSNGVQTVTALGGGTADLLDGDRGRHTPAARAVGAFCVRVGGGGGGGGDVV